MKQKSFLLILLLLLLRCPFIAAQQKLRFSIASIKQDQFDTAAKYGEYARVDGSGNNYAIIKVTSNNPNDDLSGFNFNFGNLKSIVEQHDNALWVYVQKNAKTVTISRSGYVTLSKMDLGLTVDAGCVYNLQLTFDRIQQNIVYDVNMQMVMFKTEPAIKGATVMVKSQKKGATEELLGITDASGTVSKALAFGKYTYKVMSEGNVYHIKEDIMTLNNSDETHTEIVKLQPNFAEITLKTVDGAEIYLNNEKKGTSLWKGTLVSGDYIVTTKKQYYRDAQQRISVEEGKNEIIDINPPTPITGSLSISTSPTGASIVIDGKDYGQTPRIIKDVLIGPHEVSMLLVNHKTETRNITVSEGKTEIIEATLGNIANMLISSRPSGVSLYIDGKNVGTTPYTGEFASGFYVVKAVKSKYHDYEKQMHFDSSQPNISFNMSRQFVQKNSGYAMLTFQAGSCMGLGAILGGYVYNVNVEAIFMMGFSKSEDIHWNCIADEDQNRPVLSRYKPMIIGGKVGYGFIIGNRMRITPQGGMDLLSIHSSEGGETSKAYALSTSVGARLDYAVTSFIGLSLAPEYNFAVSKSDKYKSLSEISSKIKGWSDGFNCRIGLNFFF